MLQSQLERNGVIMVIVHQKYPLCFCFMGGGMVNISFRSLLFNAIVHGGNSVDYHAFFMTLLNHHWDRKRECGTCSIWIVLSPHFASMGFNDFFGYVQAQSCPCNGFCGKFCEQPWHYFRIDTLTRVGHTDDNLLTGIIFCNINGYLPALG